MPFIKQLNKDFSIEDGQIKLSAQYIKDNSWKFKKLTATRFSSICANSEFASPVKTWCQMVGIYTEPMAEIISKAGSTIEPKIRDFVANKMNLKFISYDPKKCNYDIWHEQDWKKEKERIFGGIPDGESLDENGQLIYDDKHPILEIKTMGIDKFKYVKEKGVWVLQLDEKGHPIVTKENAGREKHFKDGKLEIPIDYRFQLALYLYLRNAPYGLFAVCFIKTEDYINPEACDVNNREIRLYKFCPKREEIQKYIDFAAKWYNEYIKGGHSPELTAEGKKWLNEVKDEQNK